MRDEEGVTLPLKGFALTPQVGLQSLQLWSGTQKLRFVRIQRVGEGGGSNACTGHMIQNPRMHLKAAKRRSFTPEVVEGQRDDSEIQIHVSKGLKFLWFVSFSISDECEAERQECFHL